MKRLLIALLALLLPLQALAAFPVNNSGWQFLSTFTSNQASYTTSFSITSGDTIWAFLTCGDNNSNTSEVVSVGDAQGTYTEDYAYNPQGHWWSDVWRIVANSTGTRTITVTQFGTASDLCALLVLEGTGTWTKQAAVGQTFAAGPSISLGGSAPSGSNNYQFPFISINSANDPPLATPSGFTNIGLAGSGVYPGVSLSYIISNSAQTPATTIADGQTWSMIIPVYQPPGGGGGSCTHSGFVQGTGAITVPTAGVTSVWKSSGGFGTVDCSSTSYWQIPGGTFGVN